MTSVAHRSDSSLLTRGVYRERRARTRKGVIPACHLLRQGTPTALDRDVRHRVVTPDAAETGGGTGLAAVDTGSTSINDDTNPPGTDVFHGLSPAEAGPLTDLVRSARPADQPDRYGPVTIAERDALLAETDRETDAECVTEGAAFVTLHHFGLDTGPSAFPYLAGWAKDPAVLRRNLAGIAVVALAIGAAALAFAPREGMAGMTMEAAPAAPGGAAVPNRTVPYMHDRARGP